MYPRSYSQGINAIEILNFGGAVMSSAWNTGYSKLKVPDFCDEKCIKYFTPELLETLHLDVKNHIVEIIETTKAQSIVFITDINEAIICASSQSERNLDKYLQMIENDEHIFEGNKL